MSEPESVTLYEDERVKVTQRGNMISQWKKPKLGDEIAVIEEGGLIRRYKFDGEGNYKDTGTFYSA